MKIKQSIVLLYLINNFYQQIYSEILQCLLLTKALEKKLSKLKPYATTDSESYFAPKIPSFSEQDCKRYLLIAKIHSFETTRYFLFDNQTDAKQLQEICEFKDHKNKNPYIQWYIFK
jgi:hypothetical protein